MLRNIIEFYKFLEQCKYDYLKIIILANLLISQILLAQPEITKSPKREHFKILKDSYGREYKERWNGLIEFPIDQNYFRAVVNANDLRVAYAESIALADIKKIPESTFVLESILHCLREYPSSYNGEPKLFIQKANIQLNKTYSKYEDRLVEIQKFSDPYLCKADSRGIYFIESREFGYKAQVPSIFNYLFIKDTDRFIGDNRTYTWKSSWFYIHYPGEKNEELDMEKELAYLSGNAPRPLSHKALLTFSNTKHILDSPTEELIIKLWEDKRGMTDKWKKDFSFQRTKNEDWYRTSFSSLEKDGQTQTYIVFEKYILLNKREVSLFLSFPSDKEDFFQKEWKKILLSFSAK
jgi:hypothetical protein